MTTDSKEVAASVTKSLFGAVPFVGQLLSEVAFDYRSRIKQNRLNHFTKLLSEYFENGKDINLENLKSEEFSDLFESVLRRVIQTKSEEKHKRFKDILISQIESPNHDVDNSETYLELVSSLNDAEIEILKAHQVFDEVFNKKDIEIKAIESNLESMNNELERINKFKIEGEMMDVDTSKLEEEIAKLNSIISSKSDDLRNIQKFKLNTYYNISNNEFLYYKQILFSKGLLIDNGVGAISVMPFQSMGITEFGKKFIEFIIRSTK